VQDGSGKLTSEQAVFERCCLLAAGRISDGLMAEVFQVIVMGKIASFYIVSFYIAISKHITAMLNEYLP
jgi:hypothetical protein